MSGGAEGHAGPLPRLVCHTTRLENSSVIDSMVGKADTVWLSPGTKLAAFGTACEVPITRSPHRFRDASASLRSLFAGAEIHDEVDVPGSGAVALGAFSFDWQDVYSELHVPSVVYGVSDTAAWKTEITCRSTRHRGPTAATGSVAGGRGRAEDVESERQNDAVDVPQNAGSAFADWLSKFERVYRLLQTGDLDKLVLARKVQVRLEAATERSGLLPVLARQFPDCYTFCLSNFIGASPELLVRRLGPIVDSMPIAGSAPRSSDQDADERMGLELMASAKDQREHRLTKEAVLAGLGPLCSQLEAEPAPSLLLLSNVQHLSTKVQGRLKNPHDCLQLVGALHPTPAVCGVPPDKALEQIRSIEGFSRGKYAGPVGWMDHRGDGEWAVALRCAELKGSSAELFAGAGILLGSDASGEFQETELKLQAILAALEETSRLC